MALTSNCSKESNHVCPIDMTNSKICVDKDNVSITDYCNMLPVKEKQWVCPKANKGLSFQQCTTA